MLPADGHVHSQFSWDAPDGDMLATCAHAVAIGLPALAFTEHVDLTAWTVHERALPPEYRGHLDQHGRFLGSALEVETYLEEVQRCRHAFPELRIWTGFELSEGHWHPAAVADLMASAAPERVVGSVHALADHRPAAVPGDHVEVGDGYDQRPPVDVVRAYLGEVAAMSASDAPFEVLGHVDYPLRYWPDTAGDVPWALLEDDFRAALEVTAASGRALEVNTRLPLQLGWSTGGTRSVGSRWSSAATRTGLRTSPATSPRPPRWSLPTVFAPGRRRTSTGAAHDAARRQSPGEASVTLRAPRRASAGFRRGR